MNKSVDRKIHARHEAAGTHQQTESCKNRRSWVSRGSEDCKLFWEKRVLIVCL